MRTLIGLGLGVLGGYTLARLLEARASRVPYGRVLRQWETPVVRILEDSGRSAVEVRKVPAVYDPDAPLAPEW